MKKHSEIIGAANELYAKLTENFATFSDVKKGQFESLSALSYDEAHNVVSGLINDAKSVISGCFSEDGTSLPKYLVTFKTMNEGDKLSQVVITIKSKLKDTFKYKKEFIVNVGDSFAEDFIQGHIDAIFGLYYRSCADSNLKEVNDVIKEICITNNIPYTFEFTLSDGNEYVVYIDDEKVVFNASLEKALETTQIGLFQSGDDYLDLVRERQSEKLIEVLLATQTTTQLVKANLDIVKTLIGYSTKRRADRLIRTAYHKKAEHFDKVKAGYGYYEGEIDGVSIFAILKKDSNGDISVSLSPFDIKTLANVEVDVVSEVTKQLAG